MEQLFKCSPWATSVINYYNKEIFGTSSVLATSGTPAPSSASQPRTWEDNFLQQLEDPASVPQTVPVPAPQLPTSSHITNHYTPTSANHADVNAVTIVNYQTAMSISNQGGPTATTQLQLEVDIGQLSLVQDGTRPDSAPSASRGGRVSAAQSQATLSLLKLQWTQMWSLLFLWLLLQQPSVLHAMVVSDQRSQGRSSGVLNLSLIVSLANPVIL
ncbi:hypothetical protein BDR07DRAFT_1497988 [Suillus spraguei]|nr:hypothetical protein BDR07DRAFT_1497988 [Suillus spraguei]